MADLKSKPHRDASRRSRSSPRQGVTLDNSASGSKVKRCGECTRVLIHTKETIHNGLQLIRVKYGLPYCELPDCDSSSLSRFLAFLLLQGKVRDPVEFPRRQVKDTDGLCRLQRLRRHERWELAHSVGSIKRNLPASCRRCTPSVRKSWEAQARSQPPPTTPEYLDHVRRQVTRIFSSGWDREYESFVGSHLPNPSARMPRLSRADHLWARRREEFVSGCLDEGVSPTLFTGRYKEVPTPGKMRPMLIYDENCDLLAPLHRLLYSVLERRTNWLLVGPPTEQRVASTCTNEYQTSVDLVSATDGLSHEVSETILDTLFFTSVKIPRSLRALAKASLSPLFKDAEGVWRRVRHGQMQGAYLSFPLLCLHSFCAASWAARDCEDARFLVNGDDTVISAGREIIANDYPSGYRLNDGKTIRAKGVVEVNSTVFLKRGGRWREVRHLRRGGALSSDYAGMRHMASAVLAAGNAWVDAFVRSRIGAKWGFLPSQLGMYTHPSHLREKGLIRGRYRQYTDLPEPVVKQDESMLRRLAGEPSLAESEALRALLWETGRLGGLKRDVPTMSLWKVRRSYRYYSALPRSFCTFVGYGKRRELILRRENKARFYLVPAEYETEEERLGLYRLELFRQELLAGL